MSKPDATYRGVLALQAAASMRSKYDAMNACNNAVPNQPSGMRAARSADGRRDDRFSRPSPGAHAGTVPQDVHTQCSGTLTLNDEMHQSAGLSGWGEGVPVRSARSQV